MTTGTRTLPCLYCDEQLEFRPADGWVHPDGGIYALRCGGCGWTGAPSSRPEKCPECGSVGLRDDHAAAPNFSHAYIED